MYKNEELLEWAKKSYEDFSEYREIYEKLNKDAEIQEILEDIFQEAQREDS